MGTLLTDRNKLVPLLAVMIVIAVGATLIVLLASGPSASGSSAPPPSSASGSTAKGGAVKTAKVTITDFKYVPATITVKSGAKIAWTDRDGANHTATGTGFDTGSISKGQTKTVTFKRAGTYRYTCSFHPFMHGTVVVR